MDPADSRRSSLADPFLPFGTPNPNDNNARLSGHHYVPVGFPGRGRDPTNNGFGKSPIASSQYTLPRPRRTILIGLSK